VLIICLKNNLLFFFLLRLLMSLFIYGLRRSIIWLFLFDHYLFFTRFVLFFYFFLSIFLLLILGSLLYNS